jgi:nicotinamide riboside transporter PnuC
MKNNILEYALAIIFVVILVAVANPGNLWMPMPVTMFTFVIAAILCAIYAGFILREGSTDEREELHRMLADRYAFLAGFAVLTLALIANSLHGRVDSWIPLSLAAMIFVKITARIRADRKR